MTSEEERRQEFMERCVGEEHGGRTRAVRLDRSDRQREAERFRNLSEYHAKAAQDNLEGQAPLMAIREGYYVMLHKANEALALAGFNAKTHECTLLGIRGIFNVPDLASALRRAHDERQNVDYYINPEKPELEEFTSPEQFVEGVMEPFVEQVNELIEEESLR